jgi:hypothetical protein
MVEILKEDKAALIQKMKEEQRRQTAKNLLST